MHLSSQQKPSSVAGKSVQYIVKSMRPANENLLISSHPLSKEKPEVGSSVVLVNYN